jgi:glutathione S-transferase
MIDLYDLAGADPALRFSPYCWRARMALAHKGLEPRLVAWRFHEHAALPGAPQNRTVPVLVDHDEIVPDSTAIAFHLEEHHTNGPSLFGGQGGEAHARFIIAWADTVLMPAASPVAIPYVFAQLHLADRDYFRQTREKRLGLTLEQARDAVPEKVQAARAVLTPLRRTLSSQDFLGGDEPSFADYAVFGTFQWLRCIGAPDLLEPGDKLVAWREALLDLFGGLARNTAVAGGG